MHRRGPASCLRPHLRYMCTNTTMQRAGDGWPTDYDGIAQRYATKIDDQPWNALYERPATLALLPDVNGKDVLDAGCGHGWYADWLARKGARVVAVDSSREMVTLAREHIGARARVIQGDISDLGNTLASGSFDIILSPLVLHYLTDLSKTFLEWARLLRPEGTLVFSTHHPVHEKRIPDPGYLCAELIEEEWGWLGKMRYYQRPLRDLTEPLCAAGFLIERISEPSPTEALKSRDPRGYEQLSRVPAFIFIRARKGK
jgi:SAM-dependent methyltransferase